jgi:peroxiredoxin Q/BCP
MLLEMGQPAPDFTLLDENNKSHTLSGYRGSPVVLYFYPRDDTPGCTTEACNFRDDHSEYEDVNAVILGVSADTPKSHAKFKEKFNLPFTLLADTETEVCRMYGVWGLKKSFGKEYEGINRTTYLIDADGVIVKVFEKVTPADHSEEVLATLKALAG